VPMSHGLCRCVGERIAISTIDGKGLVPAMAVLVTMKAVMIGLGFASLVTWTIALAKGGKCSPPGAGRVPRCACSRTSLAQASQGDRR